jgi:hypothetical protein
MMTMTRDCESNAPRACLLLAFELGQRSWKLGFSAGIGQRPRIRQIAAGAIGVIDKEILQAKLRLGLSLEAPVISCYEAEVPPGRGQSFQRNLFSAHDCATLRVRQAAEVGRACSGAIEPDMKRGPKFRAPANGVYRLSTGSRCTTC